MAFSSSIKFDMSKLKQISRDFRKLDKTEVEWGWINGKAYPASDINGRGGIPYAIIAIRNEFGEYVKNEREGTFHYIPPRPYFQQSTADSVRVTSEKSAKVINALIHGEDYKSQLRLIGQANVDALQNSIDRQNMQKLHPKTIGYKGHGRQWDDTGQLRKNITYKVIYKRADYRGGNNG